MDAAAEPELAEPDVAEPVKPRFRDRLAKARSRLAGVVGSMRRSSIDDDIWDDLEEALIGADVGVEPTQELLDHLRERVAAEGMTEGSQLLDALKDEMKAAAAGFDLELQLRRAGVRQRLALRRRQRRRQDHDHRQARPREQVAAGQAGRHGRRRHVPRRRRRAARACGPSGSAPRSSGATRGATRAR